MIEVGGMSPLCVLWKLWDRVDFQKGRLHRMFLYPLLVGGHGGFLLIGGSFLILRLQVKVVRKTDLNLDSNKNFLGYT